MPLKVCKTLWGVDEAASPAAWPSLFRRIKSAGFDAVEAPAAFTWRLDPAGFKRCLAEEGLELIAQVHTSGGTFENGAYQYMTSRDLDVHTASLDALVEEAVEQGAVMVNSHSGCDCWEVETIVKFLQHTAEAEERLGIVVAHETHRRRILHSPFQYRDVFLRSQGAPGGARVTADLSPWACVCERVFGMPSSDAENGTDGWWDEVLADVAERCALIHARVGFAEGPQVPDPRAPEYAGEFDAHMSWWRTIWRRQAARGDPISWAEPEFGPGPYLWSLPYTGMPVANLWDVNQWTHERLREAHASM